VDLKDFEKKYQRLNQQQKIAVDTIEGPVMVVAGAGTGKTQTIALRIANILRITQAPPSSILCLTFTENAALNMRQRLISIVGPAAYRVSIFTFHSFCNEIISSHPQNFIFASDIKPLDELEKIEIIKSLIDQLSTGALLKPWGDHYYYQRDILGRISDLKRENITPASLLNLIEAQSHFLTSSQAFYNQIKLLRANKALNSQITNLTAQLISQPNLPESIYNVLAYYFKLFQEDKYTEGKAKSTDVNFKNFLLSFFERLEKNIPKQLELHSLYANYQQELINRSRYDYDDMILFVLNSFKSDPDLLLEYQEKYQYILVDEYQDTNASQNTIIDLLSSYFEQPNLFVVGDDDQSIFRFQGAAIENIYHFYLKYLKPTSSLPIVLNNNYRSHQLILDSSKSVINQNKYRIANLIENVDKSLISQSTFDSTPLNVCAAPNPFSENVFIVQTIQGLLKAGVNASEIAVLFRANADVTDLIEALSAHNIKFHLETGTDILSNPFIAQLITLLNYLQNPSDSRLLYILLSYSFLHLSFVDLFQINQYCQRHRLDLSAVILSPHLPESMQAVLKSITVKRISSFRRRVALAQKWLTIYSPDRYFNRVIRKFGYLAHITSQNNIELINCLNCFYLEFKKQTIDGHLTIPTFLVRLGLMKDNRLSLFPQPLDYDYTDCVRLMTVHKAKGLEFEHVFIIKFIDKKWGNNRHYDALALPWGLVKTELALQQIEQDNEDERRLFYVALTRAKKQIYISYPTHTNAERELLPSQFLSEVDPKLIEWVKVPNSDLKNGLLQLYQPSLPKPLNSPQTATFLKTYLSNSYRLNVTHLNSYLKCPLCFYYQTVLRIPSPKDKYSSLGTAIHRSFSHLLNHLKSTGKVLELPLLLSRFEQFLIDENLTPKDQEEAFLRGCQLISDYYTHYQSELSPKVITDFDFKPLNVHLENIPLTGKIDKIEILNSTPRPDVNVVDFKTGNPDSKYEELKSGGDYYRQLVFYQILGQLAPDFKYNIVSGTIDFVMPSPRTSNFVKKDFVFNSDDLETVKGQIKEVYQKILALEFPTSPECKDRHGYHQLAQK
jgi:DNA helicase-2/ATP-dependent DNA helicase PcrA